MTFVLGFFDLFTYAIPGALQLVFLTYVAARLNWINLDAVLQAPGGLLFVGVAVVSYLLGHLIYGLSLLLDRLPSRRDFTVARTRFVERNPAALGRPFLHAHQGLLLAATELHNREVSAEVPRLRAVGLMVRSSAIPAAAGAVAAIVELVAGGARVFAACTAVLLTLVVFAAIDQGHRLRLMANLKTLELAFWMPDIDEKIRDPQTGDPPA